MNDTGHTQGPWKWEKVVGPISGPQTVTEWTLKGPDVLCRFWYDRPPGFDALLIAAAPDMLMALIGIQVIAEQNVADICADVQEGGNLSAADKMELARWGAVGAAIAKATGENQG